MPVLATPAYFTAHLTPSTKVDARAWANRSPFGLRKVLDDTKMRAVLASIAFASAAATIGPAWTRGEIEKPAGEKSRGSYTTLVCATARKSSPLDARRGIFLGTRASSRSASASTPLEYASPRLRDA